MDNNRKKIIFKINGKQIEKLIQPQMLLIDLIRDELTLKGTKAGCLEGECGACTVLINGNAVTSCLYLAVNIHGKEVTTIEGLSSDDQKISLDPVQEAIIKHGAVQCGFCTPGMIMTIKAYQKDCDIEKIIPNREEIKKNLEGNLCRCTGYTKIIDAVESLFQNSQNPRIK
jgi:carbon-monoxide dehydrogenase small subunit